MKGVSDLGRSVPIRLYSLAIKWLSINSIMLPLRMIGNSSRLYSSSMDSNLLFYIIYKLIYYFRLILNDIVEFKFFC
jgi:hypothetical protein